MRVTSLIENSCPDERPGLRAEFGLSMHIEANGVRVLFDTGSSGAFLDNAKALGVDIAAVDMAVISHQHFDHGGGLASFLEANDRAPVYLRKSPFVGRWFRAFGVLKREIGLDLDLLDRHADRVELVDGTREVAPGVFLICGIGSAHPRPPGNRRLYVEREGRFERDPFDHELMMVVHEGGGMVVFSGCSHHGILNMMDAAAAAFPDTPVHAVFGGFHLIGLPFYDSMGPSRAEVEAIGRQMLERVSGPVYSGHCTGAKGFRVLESVMGDRLRLFATGANADVAPFEG
jgi:7,8-dihydropterin-6-yl-methyl-4-(beta-D-ribofuranosyl)aminobenzene 5'-phosphate synthase